MGDEFQLGSGNWWDSSRSTRFDSGTNPTASSTLSSCVGSYESSGNNNTLLLADPNLHLMGLGLSSHNNIDWNNQSLLRGGKSGSGFRTILQEDQSTANNFQLDEQWRQNFQVDSVAYNPTNLVQEGLFSMSENQQQPSFDTTSMINYGYHQQSSYAASFPPQLLRASPPQQPKQHPPPPHGQLHFSNNTPFWNASSNTTVNNDAQPQPNFFPSAQTQLVPPPIFQEKPKNASEVGDSGKKNGSEASNKRAREETTTAMPAFKVRKEKMGDRITALQQLVSPFGKTDTASVLSEAIEYIKFLHDQVSVLSTPYMKSGAPIQLHQNTEKVKNEEGQRRQDLRSRGLCLVPVSSTFPVTHHESTVDFWTPTFGGTFR